MSEDKPLLKSKEQKEDEGGAKIKVYWQRWLVLFVYCSHIMGTNIAWMSVGSIADVAECYYGVNVFWINSLSYIFLVMYTFLFAGATYFLKRFGLRWTAILGGTFNAAGAWLRFAGSNPNYFWLLLMGQGVSSFTNVLEWSAPSLMSAVWFPQNERAFATASVGATAPQVGILLSLFIGPLAVHDSRTDTVCNTTITIRGSASFIEWQDKIYSQMLYYFLGQAVLATVLLPITFMVPASPPTPPSRSRQLEDEEENDLSLLRSALILLKNKHFIFFSFVFGMYLGVAGAYVTVYDEVFNAIGYSSYQSYMGYLGLAIQLVSIGGLLAIGTWIDYTKTFYGSTVAISVSSTIAAIGLALATQYKLDFIYLSIICSVAVGLTVIFQGVGYEYGVEMTYPVPESISAGIMNAFSQVTCTIMILVCSLLVKKHWSVYVYWMLAGCVAASAIVQVFVRPKLRRVEIDNPQTKKLLRKPTASIQS
uniref:Major facilitator superfamily (MFS) profile domain-containing protein n=1 Tax=Amphimedon queenslandica TaxID=400682 RepID=A0A1X7VCQ1_AMPQE